MLELNDNIPTEESIVHFIYDSIFTKKLHPGIKLSESVLAKEFEVSRDVVRKAFSQLQSMGILQYKKNQGFFVAWLTEQDCIDIYAARKVLELGIVRLLTEQHAKGELDLAILTDDVETEKFYKVSLKNGEYVQTSCDFHLHLALLSGNEYLINALKPLISLSILAGLIYDDETTSFCSYDEHAELIKAIESKDVERSINVMNQHLDHCVAALNYGITPKKSTVFSQMFSK